jgi:hypothetical protein
MIKPSLKAFIPSTKLSKVESCLSLKSKEITVNHDCSSKKAKCICKRQKNSKGKINFKSSGLFFSSQNESNVSLTLHNWMFNYLLHSSAFNYQLSVEYNFTISNIKMLLKSNYLWPPQH